MTNRDLSEISYSKYNFLGFFSYCLGTIVAYFTAYYSMRLLFLTFLSKPFGYKKVINFAYDSGLNISIVLVCLAIPSVFIGYCTKDLMVGLGNNTFNSVIYINLKNFNLFDAEFINFLFKSLPVCFALFGFIFALCIYIYNFKLLFRLKISQVGKKIYYFLNRK